MPRHKLDWSALGPVGDNLHLTIVEVTGTYKHARWLLLTDQGAIWCWTRRLETAVETVKEYETARLFRDA